MTRPADFDPELDLFFERTVDVPRALVWKAWTTPEHLVKWFTPAPWTTVGCEIDLRPGGIFATVMRSPEGQEFPGTGCYLEVLDQQRLSWTNALLPGYRPAPPPATPEEFAFTAVIEMEDTAAGGTAYRALARHANPGSREIHENMGFEHGWGAALDQLVALAKTWIS